MPKGNSSGRSSGRRGNTRNSSSGKSFSSGKKSSDRPYKKSSKSSDEDRPFRSKRSSTRPVGEDRPYKKSSGSSFRRKEGDTDSSKSYGGNRSDSSERRGGSRPFKRSERSSDKKKTFGNKRSSGRPEGRDSYKKSSSFSRRKEGDSGSDSSERRGGARPFKKFDKPAGSKRGSYNDSGSSERGGFSSDETPRRTGVSKPFGKRDSGDSKSTRGEEKPFKRRGDSSSSSNRSSDKESTSDRPRRTSSSKPYSKREDSDRSSSTEKHGFFKKDRSSDRKDKSKETDAPLQTDKIRLNRFIANSGVCSRREADELITMGLISVNGKVITELGYKVNPGDEIRYENRILRAEKPVYILMNKPKGYITTTDDPQERKTVMHIIGNAVRERIYPVGRLDRNTTGLLLLTNDGDLADKLMHPSYNAKKIYKVELDRPLTKADFQKILDGVRLEEGKATVDDLAIVSDDNKTVGIEIHIGWNRVVRRIFESLDYQVVRLDRSVYAGLDKKDLGRGEWRYLTKEEIVRLKHFK